MSAWTLHPVTFTRMVANAAEPWHETPASPLVVGPLIASVGRRISRAIAIVGPGPAEAVPEAFSVVVYINQSDNPATPLTGAGGAAIVCFGDTVTVTDTVPSALNGKTATVEVVRIYDGQLQVNVLLI